MHQLTPLTRRSLLRSGATAAAAALVGVRPWAPAQAAAAGPAGHLLRSSYAGLTGQRFATESTELRLLSVSDLAGAAVQPSLVGSEDAFALTFSGPLDAALETGTHTLRHADLGTLELFVSPVEQPRTDRRYEAVVDRSVGAPKSPPKRATPAAPAAEAPAAAPDAQAAAPKRARLLRRVTLRRTPRGARAEIALRPAANADRVHGRLMRRGKTIALASHNVREQRAVLRFRDAPHLPAGAYMLLLTVVDDAGLIATRRRRVTLA
jgi:hypothetical protein